MTSQTSTEFLEDLVSRGWSDKTAQSFEERFGDDIRRLLVLHLWRLGIVEYRFDPSRAESILSASKLELLQATVADVWLELLDGLAVRYLDRHRTGQIGQEFLAYLSGVIKHLLIRNAQNLGLLPRESIAEMFRALCKAGKLHTRWAHIARIKFRLWHQVENELLSACSEGSFNDVYQNIYRIVDYFLEDYLPRNCGAIARLGKRKAMKALVDGFDEEEVSRAKEFVGTVTPFSADARIQSIGQQRAEDLMGLIAA